MIKKKEKQTGNKQNLKHPNYNPVKFRAKKSGLPRPTLSTKLN